jgi:hypothetical protein
VKEIRPLSIALVLIGLLGLMLINYTSPGQPSAGDCVIFIKNGEFYKVVKVDEKLAVLRNGSAHMIFPYKTFNYKKYFSKIDCQGEFNVTR